ncbi:hypothetical protein CAUPRSCDRAFT_11189 [Caulochytrium protostelioides]|uniref:Uncharacterized protein n=1 Tax=Caulochytrium protostelioides TaxID=1555241 RepID=A0A4P9WWN5_9FUNG|nr:hypothetical protein CAUPRSCDRAFT_11189 [Caulochytrium protostelioides]
MLTSSVTARAATASSAVASVAASAAAAPSQKCQSISMNRAKSWCCDGIHGLGLLVIGCLLLGVPAYAETTPPDAGSEAYAWLDPAMARQIHTMHAARVSADASVVAAVYRLGKECRWEPELPESVLAAIASPALSMRLGRRWGEICSATAASALPILWNDAARAEYTQHVVTGLHAEARSHLSEVLAQQKVACPALDEPSRMLYPRGMLARRNDPAMPLPPASASVVPSTAISPGAKIAAQRLVHVICHVMVTSAHSGEAIPKTEITDWIQQFAPGSITQATTPFPTSAPRLRRRSNSVTKHQQPSVVEVVDESNYVSPSGSQEGSIPKPVPPTSNSGFRPSTVGLSPEFKPSSAPESAPKQPISPPIAPTPPIAEIGPIPPRDSQPYLRTQTWPLGVDGKLDLFDVILDFSPPDRLYSQQEATHWRANLEKVWDQYSKSYQPLIPSPSKDPWFSNKAVVEGIIGSSLTKDGVPLSRSDFPSAWPNWVLSQPEVIQSRVLTLLGATSEEIEKKSSFALSQIKISDQELKLFHTAKTYEAAWAAKFRLMEEMFLNSDKEWSVFVDKVRKMTDQVKDQIRLARVTVENDSVTPKLKLMTNALETEASSGYTGNLKYTRMALNDLQRFFQSDSAAEASSPLLAVDGGFLAKEYSLSLPAEVTRAPPKETLEAYAKFLDRLLKSSQETRSARDNIYQEAIRSLDIQLSRLGETCKVVIDESQRLDSLNAVDLALFRSQYRDHYKGVHKVFARPVNTPADVFVDVVDTKFVADAYLPRRAYSEKAAQGWLKKLQVTQQAASSPTSVVVHNSLPWYKQASLVRGLIIDEATVSEKLVTDSLFEWSTWVMDQPVTTQEDIFKLLETKSNDSAGTIGDTIRAFSHQAQAEKNEILIRKAKERMRWWDNNMKSRFPMQFYDKFMKNQAPKVQEPWFEWFNNHLHQSLVVAKRDLESARRMLPHEVPKLSKHESEVVNELKRLINDLKNPVNNADVFDAVQASIAATKVTNADFTVKDIALVIKEKYPGVSNARLLTAPSVEVRADFVEYLETFEKLWLEYRYCHWRLAHEVTSVLNPIVKRLSAETDELKASVVGIEESNVAAKAALQECRRIVPASFLDSELIGASSRNTSFANKWRDMTWRNLAIIAAIVAVVGVALYVILMMTAGDARRHR